MRFVLPERPQAIGTKEATKDIVSHHRSRASHNASKWIDRHEASKGSRIVIGENAPLELGEGRAVDRDMSQKTSQIQRSTACLHEWVLI